MIVNPIYFLSLLCVVDYGFIDAAVNQFRTNLDINRKSKTASRIKDEILNYRLPNHTKPLHYDIKLSTAIHKGERGFKGTVVIDLEVLEDTSSIVLHAKQLKDIYAEIRSVDNKYFVLRADYDNEREFLNLSSAKKSVTFPKYTNWTLTIIYSGTLSSNNQGFYFANYTESDGSTKYFASTNFESTKARCAFPCYDEPAKRATFAIKIEHHASYKAISNMPVKEDESSETFTTFETTPKMSTYLLAIIISEFTYSAGTLNSLPQSVYSRNTAISEREWGLTTGLLIEKHLADYYDVPFLLPKLDQAALPNTIGGAMENWGLVIYNENFLLYNQENSTVVRQTEVAVTVGHEYTHMWFGDLVTIEWWTYLWLKEGFATQFQYISVDLTYPEWDIFQLFHEEKFVVALNADANGDSRPLTHYVQKPGEIEKLYDNISYGKGGAVLDMWRNALTNKVFQRGLHNYLEINKFGSATEYQLFNAIGIAAKEEDYKLVETIENMMSSWTHQSGFPLLTVTRDESGGKFTITQEAYSNSNEKITQNKTWFIPINYVVKSNPDFKLTEATHYLLNKKKLTIKAKDLSKTDWLIVNKQSTGYYRINYDIFNWKLIIDSLISQPHKIHTRNRAQLINDAYELSNTKHLGRDVLLELLTYLSKETQYAPWSMANTALTKFNHYLSGDDQYDVYRHYVRSLVADQFELLGLDDVHGEHHLNKYTRPVLINLACMAGIESCLNATNAVLRAQVSEHKRVSPNLVMPIYCNGLHLADNQDFDYFYDQFLKTNDPKERKLLTCALGYVRQAELLHKFIASSVDEQNQLNPQERSTLLSAAYKRGELGLLTAIEFLDKNWQQYGKLETKPGSVNPLQKDIVSMSGYVVNDKQKKELLALVDAVKGSSYVSANLEETVLRNIKNNYDWLAVHREPLLTWMLRFRANGVARPVSSYISIGTALVALASSLLCN